MNNLIKMLIHIVFYIGFYCFIALVVSLIFGIEFNSVTNSPYTFLYIVLGWIPNVILEEDLESKFPTKPEQV